MTDSSGKGEEAHDKKNHSNVFNMRRSKGAMTSPTSRSACLPNGPVTRGGRISASVMGRDVTGASQSGSPALDSLQLKRHIIVEDNRFEPKPTIKRVLPVFK